MAGLEPKIDFISLIIFLGIVQALFFAILLFKKIPKPLGVYIGMTMLLLGILEADSFLSYTGYMANVPHLVNVAPTFIFLLGPLVYLYTKRALSPTLASRFSYFHFLTFALYFLYSAFFFFQPAARKLNAFLSSFQPDFTPLPVNQTLPIDPLNIRGLVVVEGFSLHLIVYVFASFVLIGQYLRSKGIGILSSSDRNFNWIRFLNVYMAIGSIVFLLTGGVINGKVLFHSPLPSYAVNIFVTVFIYSVTYYFHESPLSLHGVGQKYSRSMLPAEFKKRKIKLLREIMDREKPFLDCGFSLDDLAKKVTLTPHQASQILNEELNMSFFELTHSYRIREAQRILRGTDNGDLKMEVLAHELGYNSKSAFFNAFRRLTATTPARFREVS